MNFLSPWRLLLLAAPLALLVAYLVMQRARQRYAVRFTSVDLLASVAPRRPGWQRHLAAGALVAALVLLVVGFARPTSTQQVAKDRGTVVLVLDVSNSMGASDVEPTRLAAAQDAASAFVDKLPAGLQVGLLSFDRTARVSVAPTADRAAIKAGIAALKLGPGTATGDAIYLALDTAASVPAAADGSKVPAAIVLMSDGTPTIGRGDETPEQTVEAASAAAKEAKIPVNTIAYGTAGGSVDINGRNYSVPTDPATLKQIAETTSGKAFTAETAGQLGSVYDQIQKVVGFDTEQTEITAWFTGAGLLLASLAAVAALVWSQRMI
jgi:Ca-activated chloride channel family protein